MVSVNVIFPLGLWKVQTVKSCVLPRLEGTASLRPPPEKVLLSDSSWVAGWGGGSCPLHLGEALPESLNVVMLRDFSPVGVAPTSQPGPFLSQGLRALPS